MQLPLLSCGLLGLLASQVVATALTYKVHANERACFYTATQNKDEKIAFYFAVCAPIVGLWTTYSLAVILTRFYRCNPVVPSISITK